MAKNDNPQAFKHWINEAVIRKMAEAILKVYPDFNEKSFIRMASNLAPLELKARVQLIRDGLYTHLPQDYPKALSILMNSLKQSDLSGFSLWPYTEFIQTYGLEHFDESFQALFELTQKFTSEFAVRPFLVRYPKKSYSQLLKWAQHSNTHVRRWTSEGTRPRLPWGMKLHDAIKDPTPGLKILEKLISDPELYVRKSVANHLNDIAKDHPQLVVDTLKEWEKILPPASHSHFTWIKRHALRSLIKSGFPPALNLIGVDTSAKVKCSNVQIDKTSYKLNENIRLSFKITSLAKKPQKLVVDYIVHFQKSNGQTSPKVFKLKTFELGPQDSITIEKKHPLKVVTTRRYYPGKHRIEIQINGQVVSGADWSLRIK